MLQPRGAFQAHCWCGGVGASRTPHCSMGDCNLWLAFARLVLLALTEDRAKAALLETS